jgi:hypothetical protein
VLLLEAAVALSVGLASRLTSSSTSHEVVASPRATASGRALASIYTFLDHDVGGNISHPSWPLDHHVLSFCRGSQGIAQPLLAVFFAEKLGGLTTHVVDEPPVALVSWVDGIRTPQLVALLVLLWYTEARVDNVEVLEATGKQKVLVKGPTVSQTLPDVLLKALLQPVRCVVGSHTVVDVEVARHWCQKEDDSSFQDVKDRQAVSKKHIQSLLASSDKLSISLHACAERKV